MAWNIWFMDDAVSSHIPERDIPTISDHHSQISLNCFDVLNVFACTDFYLALIIVPVESLPFKITRKNSVLWPLKRKASIQIAVQQVNRVFISFLEETNRSLIGPSSNLTRVTRVMSGFVDFQLVSESKQWLHSRSRHISRIFMQLSHRWKYNFWDVDVLGLGIARRVSGMYASIDGFSACLLLVRQPLEG